jgi:Methyltransferase small domain
MLERIRAGLRRLRSCGLDYPPPTLDGGSGPPEIRAAIAAFYELAPERFTRFFLHERTLRASRREAPLLRSLEPVGLVTHLAASLWRPCVRIVPFPGRFVVADLFLRRSLDQVFSPMFEQMYFLRNVIVEPDDEVLEIGVGSGVLGLSLADTASEVTGVEINPRALAFARFNLELQPTAGIVDWRPGSLYEPIESGRRFDLVVSNPPFEPTPPDEVRFLHSDAGEDGLDVARDIVAGVASHLKADGRLAMITWSPGSSERVTLVDLVRDALPTHRIEVHVLESWPIEEHIPALASHPEPGLTDMHCIFLQATPAQAAELTVIHPREEIMACHALADTWKRSTSASGGTGQISRSSSAS